MARPSPPPQEKRSRPSAWIGCFSGSKSRENIRDVSGWQPPNSGSRRDFADDPKLADQKVDGAQREQIHDRTHGKKRPVTVFSNHAGNNELCHTTGDSPQKSA